MKHPIHLFRFSPKQHFKSLVVLQLIIKSGRLFVVEFGFLVTLMLVSSFAELLTIGTFIPFISILLNPTDICNSNIYRYLPSLYHNLGSSALSLCQINLTIYLFLVVLSSSIIRLFTLYRNGIYAAKIGSYLTAQMYQTSLFKDYEYHLETNSSSIISTIVTKSNGFVQSLSGFLSLLNGLLITTTIIIGLTLYNVSLASFTFLSLGIVYIFIALASKQYLNQNSKIITYENETILKLLAESFDSIRDIILNSTQLVYLQQFEPRESRYRRRQAYNVFLSTSPRYIVEAIAILVLAVIALSAILTNPSNNASYISRIIVFAVALQRLLPSIQQIYSGWSTINSFTKDVADINMLLSQSTFSKVFSSASSKNKTFCFSSLEFRNLNFTYQNRSKKTLNRINLKIQPSEKIAILGSTGSGKSTLLDIIMGLLPHTDGDLYVNNNLIQVNRDNSRLILDSWKTSIAHVPQNVFLFDTTIEQNIAINVASKSIDKERIKYISNVVGIHDFICSLPQGYQTIVGEAGANLSGGQRQRIGIARALYQDFSILVLDEATSALDQRTSDAITSNIFNALKDETIISVTHSTYLAQKYDRIIKLSSGSIIYDGMQR